ncbi:MAG: UbiA family prenyltransferase, partial [Myxococcales bacterium]|nr:UbiA family prenyltransferase [Myxococcales bacterium]
MRRTAKRPLPSGRLLPVEAWIFALTNLAAGAAVLLWVNGWIPAALSLLTAALYAFV